MNTNDTEALFRDGLQRLMASRDKGEARAACAVIAKAAERGHPAAQVRLGQCYHQGLPLEFEPGHAIDLYRSALEKGSVEAAFWLAEALAVGLDGVEDLEQSRALYQRAADGGHPQAACQLAYMCDRGLSGPSSAGQATRLIQGAARAGLARAWFELGHRFIRGAALVQDLAMAAACARRAARIGYPQAEALVAEIGSCEDVDASAALHAATDAEPVPSPTVDVVRIEEVIGVSRIEGLLRPEDCAHIISRALPLLQPSKVVSKSSHSVDDPVRRSGEMGFILPFKDLVTRQFELRIARAIGLPDERGEPIVILRYGPGDEYRPHHDFFDPARGFTEVLAQGGQRVETVLTYLNTVESGGATEFPRLGMSVEPARGRAVSFRNVDVEGAIERRSLHTGRPVVAGEKWLATRWFREHPWVPAI